MIEREFKLFISSYGDARIQHPELIWPSPYDLTHFYIGHISILTEHLMATSGHLDPRDAANAMRVTMAEKAEKGELAAPSPITAISFIIPIKGKNHLFTTFFALPRPANIFYVQFFVDGKLADSPDIKLLEPFSSLALDYIMNKDVYFGESKAETNIKKFKKGKDVIIPVVIVSKKREISEFPTLRLGANEPVDWKHSWECVGHWRKISGIGKDVDGNYRVIGKTWVLPCVKGNGELIKKLRVVK